MNPQNEKSMGVRSGDLGGHDLSIFSWMFSWGAAPHTCDSGEGPHLVAKSHSLYPVVEQEVLQNIEVYVTSIASLGDK
jgi:hypothetical protein